MTIVECAEIIFKKFEIFTDGIRVLMLIDRGVMNSNKGSRRWINKIITHDKASFQKALIKLLALQYHLNEPSIRLYSCVNDRKLENAIKRFQHCQLDLTKDNYIKFYTNINDEFCSSLMKPEMRKSKYFLLDVDSKSSIAKFNTYGFLVKHKIEKVMSYDTKNGFHVITHPFDVRLAQDQKQMTLQKDGLVLLHYLPERMNYMEYLHPNE